MELKDRWSDSIIRPVKKTLLGDEDYSGSDLKPEDVEVAPIGDVMSELCSLPWDAWTDYAFAREPLNGRLDETTRRELMQRARDCGEQWARDSVSRFGTKSPRRIAEGLGAQIRFDEVPQGQDRVLFAEYVEPSLIYVYEDALAKARPLTEDPAVRKALGPGVTPKDILLAHEVFHLIEFQRGDEVWTKQYREKIRFGPISYRSSLVVLGEIASMAFAGELLGTSYSPYVFDTLLTWGYSPAAGMTLYNEVMGYQCSPDGGESSEPLDNGQATDAGKENEKER